MKLNRIRMLIFMDTDIEHTNDKNAAGLHDRGSARRNWGGGDSHRAIASGHTGRAGVIASHEVHEQSSQLVGGLLGV